MGKIKEKIRKIKEKKKRWKKKKRGNDKTYKKFRRENKDFEGQ